MGTAQALMIFEFRPGTSPVRRSAWSGAEARGFEPRMGANPNRISSPFRAVKKGPRPPAPDPIRAGQQGRAGKAPQAVTVLYRTCCAIFVPSRTPATKLTATRESRWALRGEADDRGAVPLRVRQLALEAGKLLVHVEAGEGNGRGEPGRLLPGRLDGRTGAALLTLLQALLTALLVALAGALVLLPSLERGEERSGDQ